MAVMLMIGTGKGLFLARSDDDRKAWQVSQPHYPMNGIYAVAIDMRGGAPRLLASVTSSHFGPSLVTSDNLGESWHEPDHAPVAFPEETGAALKRVWQIAPAPASHPDRIYVGTEPSALFVSDDGGENFRLVWGLWNHPHREHWGAGFGGQAIHTVLPHPIDPDTVLVAMSTGGVYRTADSGENWVASNTGIKAYFMPDQFPEYGQCVHKVARNPSRPEEYFAQNHHGVYRSIDGGGTWLSIADGLPTDFGFPILVHPHRPGVVYNFPVTADGQRFPPDFRCRVYRSLDAGASWTALSEGLPTEAFYPVVLRDAMCADDAYPAGIYFGTRNGEVYASADEGDSWQQVAAHLPEVLSIRAAVVG
jgi:hypothetical protein